MPVTIFLSHSTHDDATVAALRTALEGHGVSVWADSQRLSAGEELTPRIQEAIANAQHFVVLVSPRAINAPWVHKEVQLAQAVKRSRHHGYKVIPVLYDGVTAGAIPWLFDAEILAMMLGSGPNAIAAAVPDLLVALGVQLPDDPPLPAPLETVPLAGLTLHLTERGIIEQDGKRRATAVAELTYQPPDGGPAVRSGRYRVIAPLGPLEADELAWYLERYAIWPSPPFQHRAREVENALPRWGQALWTLLQAAPSTQKPLEAWQAGHGANDRHQRRLSVLVDERLLDGASAEEQRQARAAATQWLSLPWELLHDAQSYLYQGARGVRVRRQLPSPQPRPRVVTAPPLRVLLVSPVQRTPGQPIWIIVSALSLWWRRSTPSASWRPTRCSRPPPLVLCRTSYSTPMMLALPTT